MLKSAQIQTVSSTCCSCWRCHRAPEWVTAPFKTWLWLSGKSRWHELALKKKAMLPIPYTRPLFWIPILLTAPVLFGVRESLPKPIRDMFEPGLRAGVHGRAAECWPSLSLVSILRWKTWQQQKRLLIYEGRLAAENNSDFKWSTCLRLKRKLSLLFYFFVYFHVTARPSLALIQYLTSWRFMEAMHEWNTIIGATVDEK